MSDADEVRIGTTEREAVIAELGEHFAQGRIDMAEFEQRSSAAGAAKFQSELDALLEDLPGKRKLVRSDAVAMFPASQAELTPPAESSPADTHRTDRNRRIGDRDPAYRRALIEFVNSLAV